MVFCNRFIFKCLFHTFDRILNTYLLSSWLCCVDIFYAKFRFCETFTSINSVSRVLLNETLYKFKTISVDLPYTYICVCFKASINSNVLYVPPRFLAFHIPLIFAIWYLHWYFQNICLDATSEIFYFTFLIRKVSNL